MTKTSDNQQFTVGSTPPDHSAPAVPQGRLSAFWAFLRNDVLGPAPTRDMGFPVPQKFLKDWSASPNPSGASLPPGLAARYAYSEDVYPAYEDCLAHKYNLPPYDKPPYYNGPITNTTPATSESHVGGLP